MADPPRSGLDEPQAEEKAGGLWATLEQATETPESETPLASGSSLWDTIR